MGTVHSNTYFSVSRESAIRFIIALGTISLLADLTDEGARSINGPFLGSLGAGAAVVGIVSVAGELIGYVLRPAGSSAVGILYGWSLNAAVAFAMTAQVAAIPLLLIARRRHI